MTGAAARNILDFEIMVLKGLAADFDASHGLADDLLLGFVARRKNIKAAERHGAQ